MSTARFDTLQNAAGSVSVPVNTVANGSAKAWVNFNGTGTVAIRAAFNVSSITDNAVGDYTINFAATLADANYAVTCSGRPNTQYMLGVQVKTGTVPTTGAVNISTGSYNTAFVDTDYLFVAAYR